MRPAFADGASAKLAMASSGSPSGKYWTASSEYLVTPAGASTVNARTPRKVMISGWHPVAGFEAEIAEEAANRAAHTVRQ